MQAYVHADSKDTKKEKIRILKSLLRMSSTKLQILFSVDLAIYLCMILATASLMITDSYYKARNRSLHSDVVEKLVITEDMEWQKETVELEYFKMTASKELMQKAKELKLSVITSDKFVKFD